MANICWLEFKIHQNIIEVAAREILKKVVRETEKKNVENKRMMEDKVALYFVNTLHRPLSLSVSPMWPLSGLVPKVIDRLTNPTGGVDNLGLNT